MKKLLKLFIIGAMTCAWTPHDAIAAPAKYTAKVKGPVGLQLYSLRNQFAKDVPGTLDIVRDYRLKYVELAGTYGLTPEQFNKELKSRGLVAISGHFSFERFRDDPEGVAAEAKILGTVIRAAPWVLNLQTTNIPFPEMAEREARLHSVPNVARSFSENLHPVKILAGYH